MTKKEEDEDQAAGAAFSDAVKLAASVATEARRQLARYRDTVEVAAAKIDKASKQTRKTTEVEKQLMRKSTQAASSVADVLIDAAETAFDEISQESEDTRRRAMALLRRVVKLAVDDTLDGAFEGPPRSAAPTATTVELTGEDAVQSIYLPRTLDSAALKVRIDGSLRGDIQVRSSTADTWKTLNRTAISITVTGSRPRLSIRLRPKYKLGKPAVALLHITGDQEHVIAVTVRTRK